MKYFSVIIPTFNRAVELKELLDCLVKQTYKYFEVLICDDGSSDGTDRIVSLYNQQLDINYMYLKNSGGPATPRNHGIINAKFDWLCFVDSDDLWTENKLEVLSKYLCDSSKVIYSHPVKIIGNNNEYQNKLIGNYKKGFLLDDFESLVYNGSQIVNSSICVNKKFIGKDFFYNTCKDFHGIEDFIFLLNLTYNGFRIVNIPLVLGYYRIHDNNISSNVESQLNKLTLFFASKPYARCNYSMVHSHIEYVRTTNCFESTSEIAISYFKLIFSPSSFQIKAKSIFRLFNFYFR